MPGSDVDILLNRVLPGAPAGLLVHIHDIFLPWDYPEDWAPRFYSEQYVVAAYLFGGADGDEVLDAELVQSQTLRIGHHSRYRLVLGFGM